MRVARSLVVACALLVAALAPVMWSPEAHAADVTFVLEMRNVIFDPDVLTVNPGDRVTILVFNNDSFDHTFELPDFGVSSGVIGGGGFWETTFTANEPGTHYFYCAIPGHATPLGGGRWDGMAGQLIVGSPSDGPDPLPIVIGGVVVLAIVLIAVTIVATRKKK